MQTRCPTCLREETHHDGQVTVVHEGGQRAAPKPTGLAEWAIVRASLDGGPAIFGPCAACGMPMTKDAGESSTWTIHLPDGELQISEGALSGPSGPLSSSQAQTWVETSLKVEKSLALALYQGAMFSWLIVPFLIWISAMICFGMFLCIGVPQGAEFMPR